MKQKFPHSFALLFLLLASSCGIKDPFRDNRDSNLVGNQPPQTHLFLQVAQTQISVSDTLSDGTIVTRLYTAGLDTTPSRQIVHWWGDDPDGSVAGYYYQWIIRLSRFTRLRNLIRFMYLFAVIMMSLASRCGRLMIKGCRIQRQRNCAFRFTIHRQ